MASVGWGFQFYWNLNGLTVRRVYWIRLLSVLRPEPVSIFSLRLRLKILRRIGMEKESLPWHGVQSRESNIGQ